MDDSKRVEQEAIAALTADQYDRACGILLSGIDADTWVAVGNAIAKDPAAWWVGHHFGWSMGVRNLLREKGFTDKESKSGNLDDIYIPLVEAAARRHLNP